MLLSSKIFESHEKPGELIMDSNPLEKKEVLPYYQKMFL